VLHHHCLHQSAVHLLYQEEEVELLLGSSEGAVHGVQTAACAAWPPDPHPEAWQPHTLIPITPWGPMHAPASRMITQRSKVLVFNYCYHGSVDETFITLGWVRLAPAAGPLSGATTCNVHSIPCAQHIAAKACPGWQQLRGPWGLDLCVQTAGPMAASAPAPATSGPRWTPA